MCVDTSFMMQRESHKICVIYWKFVHMTPTLSLKIMFHQEGIMNNTCLMWDTYIYPHHHLCSCNNAILTWYYVVVTLYIKCPFAWGLDMCIPFPYIHIMSQYVHRTNEYIYKMITIKWELSLVMEHT